MSRTETLFRGIMFQLIIVPNNANAAASVYYKEKETAEAALKKTHSGHNIFLDDDFGNQLRLPNDNFSYAMLMDLTQNPFIQFEKELATQAAGDVIMADPRFALLKDVKRAASANNSLIRGQ